MSPTVAVLGAGYAGTGAVTALQEELDGADVVWVSENDYHFVLHEAHRLLRDPGVQDDLTVPVEEIKDASTRFVEGHVEGLDCEERVVELADGDDVAYDYAVVALGSSTAYYGIPGLAEHAHTLKNRRQALGVHDDVVSAARDATREDPARVVVGGAGLSGIQSAGEIAAFREERNAPVEIVLVEALEEIFPPGDPEIQGMLKRYLQEAGVQILVDDPITEATADAIQFEERDDLAYDVFLWTGGITGREALAESALENEHNRLTCKGTFETSDDRVFAVGDSAIVEQNDQPAPPTAHAAWSASDVLAGNVKRAIQGRPLKTWHYEDAGTLVSIGDDAIAHEVPFTPVRTFNSLPAKVLKKGAAARWLTKIAGPKRAARAWNSL